MTSLLIESPDTICVAVPGPFSTPLTYACSKPVAPGCRVEVPLGKRSVIGVVVEQRPDEQLDMAKLRAVERILDDTPVLPTDILALAEWMSRYYLHEFASPYLLALPGLLRKGEAATLPTETWLNLTVAGEAIDPAQLKRSTQHQAIMTQLQQSGRLPWSHLRAQGFTRPQAQALEKKQLLSLDETCDNDPIPPTGQLAEPSLTLNDEQSAALDQVSEARFAPFLLEGITGSGKTEVYLQAIERCLSRGHRALVLIPEIGLTPQTVARFERRFRDRCVILHSGLTDKQRTLAWLQANHGQAAIVIGTRSAVLTPIPDLGLIVIDEEHDASFKQQDTLRYQARDVALKRAQLADIPIILGTATPSLETLHNALTGRFGHLQLKERAGGARLPTIELIDMRRQQQQHGLSERLLIRIREHLNDGNQVLLFLNRRGFAPSWFCHSCGWIADCVFCDAHLTYHHHGHINICHHCGHREPPPTVCPDCHSRDLSAMGTGTERAEQLLESAFADVPIIRFDRDVASTRLKFEQQLEKTAEDGPAIIVGTQMLAKGHHFHRVTLVGVWDSDGGLFSADLRAKERMGQLLTQVAGRSGRGERTGEVLIQTYYPDNPIFQPLTEHDYRSFAFSLLEERRKTRLPPFGFVAVVRADSAFAERAEELLATMTSYLLEHHAVRVLGPLPALLSRRAGKHRFMLIIQADRRSALHEALVPLHRHYPRQTRQVSWHIDIDPADLA
ncbi:primosomal protein N' [Reinekea blandensis]|uniref:Replication restart protein PriA n=1 Tax=Reinekea blandensis MED297 TaxID=314283 RepID=A4BGC2_9GAMM|nr:primosomal protein N' [Reinekea blandensis]EAR08917.1 primosome assembly protein PriA [Reinekea sp. MED297] [Reinekea blandensis MED297]